MSSRLWHLEDRFPGTRWIPQRKDNGSGDEGSTMTPYVAFETDMPHGRTRRNLVFGKSTTVHVARLTVASAGHRSKDRVYSPPIAIMLNGMEQSAGSSQPSFPNPHSTGICSALQPRIG